MSYPTPFRSAQAFAARDQNKPQNPGLIFDRFAPDWGADATIKKAGLVVVCKAAAKADAALLAAWHSRWEADAQATGALTFTAKTDWRFIPGLGRKGPLEVGFTFHRYGFPILPGSSVKGIARAYAWLVEGRRESDPDFLAIFGRAPGPGEEEQAQSGQAIFFDAIPRQLPGLELDVMNPHFPEYYQDNTGKVPPTDWQNPVPIYFLTVAPNTEFCFAVGWRGPLDKRLHNLAKEWLGKGLSQLGAGAKTSAGYGYFLPEAEALARRPLSAVPIQPKAPPLPVPALPRKSGQGKVRYEGGKPYIHDLADSTLHLRVDWRALGVDSLADKVMVDYEYEELPDGSHQVVKVAKQMMH